MPQWTPESIGWTIKGMTPRPTAVVIHLRVVRGNFDTLVWQALASVIVPGFTINRICAGSLFSLAKVAPKLPLNTRKWITTAVGLGVIPFIVHPIDSGVHWGMDNTTRKWIGGADIKLD
jgi:fission process protein 1